MSDIETRPDPDALLAQLQTGTEPRGALKIFFGYAAGVGKTYAMLENARRAQAAGREVVVGYVEPHARPETQALLTGLETLPALETNHRGIRLREFDVDGALARRPEVLLVDELAHTNAEGMRHEKRWQDVEELLAAGITVWTTLNVQHIESLNDVIGQITGVVVRETVPDRIFELADELELVDLPPEDLLERLRAGRIYLPDQAHRALGNFFQRSNLNVLRELSLRQAARRIHTDVESDRRQKDASQPWATADRLLVCVGPSPTTARVIRTARRMAAALDAPWLAVAVDPGGSSANSPARQQISQHLRLAERLGAETLTLPGQDVCETILDCARSRNVTKIFIGKTNQPRWRRLLFGTVVDELLENSGRIDVYVIHGERDPADVAAPAPPARGMDGMTCLRAAVIVAAAGGLAAGLRTLRLADAEANTVMVFLAAVAWVAFQQGRGPAVLASVLAVLTFDFFFVPPFYTFAVADTQYVMTFGVMLAIGLLISTLTSRLRAQIIHARLRERRTSALYELGRQLSSLYGEAFLVAAAGEKIAEITGGEVAVYLQHSSGSPQLAFGLTTSIAQHPVSAPTAEWVIEHDQPAGAGTSTLPNAVAVFFPLTGSQRTLGALAVRTTESDRLLDPDQRRLLETCGCQLALALERDQLVIDAAEARIQAESEQVRSTLLSSVSHDLKTPLAAIAGAGSSLLESRTLDEETRRQLMQTVVDEATHLNRLLENILQMSRLEAGAVEPNRQWHVLEEIVGSALHRTRLALAAHPVDVQLADDLPLIFVDGLLLEQLLMNLLENAARYTPPQTPVRISASKDGAWLRLSVSDDGPGLPPGDEERIFEKFYTSFGHPRDTSDMHAAPAGVFKTPDALAGAASISTSHSSPGEGDRGSAVSDGGRGSGLGLAICRAIARAHGGDITAANRPVQGAEFVLQLPLAKDAPQVIVE